MANLGKEKNINIGLSERSLQDCYLKVYCVEQIHTGFVVHIYVLVKLPDRLRAW